MLKDHFWINPFGKHFSTMKASDLVLVDSEGYVTEGGNQAPINEAGFMIHSEIHKARPDVVAAAHTHGIYGKTWSAFGRPIEMLSQGESPFPPPFFSRRISQSRRWPFTYYIRSRCVQLLREAERVCGARRHCAGPRGGRQNRQSARER